MNLGLVRDDFSFEAGKSFSSLFDQPDFSDVTLVCEDQKYISAHKVILASGSSFLKNVLSLNPHPKPLIYLRLKLSDLEEIVRFIYTGQCKVAQDDLDGFLEIAKSLEICGIANNEDSNDAKSYETVNNANNEASKTIISEIDNLSKNAEDKDYKVDGAFENGINEKNNRIKEETDKSEVKHESEENADLSCNKCDLTFETNPQLKEHMREAHLYCCKKLFSSVRSLKTHKWAQRNKEADESHKSDHRTTKVDSDLHYPETEEKLSFFGSGRKKNQAYDKYFYTFSRHIAPSETIDSTNSDRVKNYRCSNEKNFWCRVLLKTTADGKVLYRKGIHNHEAIPALVQVQKLEEEKLEEMLRNPETASAKNLLLSISKEILNPQMAAFASTHATLARKLQRRLKEMKKVSAHLD